MHISGWSYDPRRCQEGRLEEEEKIRCQEGQEDGDGAQEAGQVQQEAEEERAS